MEDAETPEVEMPAELFAVRIFTIADYATDVTESGKLYVHGGGVDTIWMSILPGPLTPVHLALRLSVPWQNLTEPFDLRIRALNLDRTPVGQDPIFHVHPEIGRPPGMRPGDEAAINVALGLGGLEVQTYGTIFFHLEIDGKTLARLPLKIVPL